MSLWHIVWMLPAGIAATWLFGRVVAAIEEWWER